MIKLGIIRFQDKAVRHLKKDLWKKEESLLLWQKLFLITVVLKIFLVVILK